MSTRSKDFGEEVLEHNRVMGNMADLASRSFPMTLRQSRLRAEREQDIVDRLRRQLMREFPYLLADLLSGLNRKVPKQLFNSEASQEVSLFISANYPKLKQSALRRFLAGEFTTKAPIRISSLQQKAVEDFLIVLDVLETMAKVVDYVPSLRKSDGKTYVMPIDDPITTGPSDNEITQIYAQRADEIRAGVMPIIEAAEETPVKRKPGRPKGSTGSLKHRQRKKPKTRRVYTAEQKERMRVQMAKARAVRLENVRKRKEAAAAVEQGVSDDG